MVRNQILQALEAQRGTCISGEALAGVLGVSRAAIWKAIEKLRAEGLQIDAVPGGGYCLRTEDDSLTVEAIHAGLQTASLGRSALVLRETDSTNTQLKREHATAPHGFAVFAEAQTAGRGRLGRSFASPAGDGLYMSVLLRPHVPLAQLNFLTLAAAVAVCRAVRDTAGFTPDIKWVNDVLMGGKKLCGILTEASIEGETGAIDFAVLGIGINLRHAALPEAVRSVAGCLADFSNTVPRRATLAAAILNHLEALYALVDSGDTAAVLAAYREYLCVLGRRVQVLSPTESYEAVAEALDDNGHLLVRTDDGALRTISAGEISIRL